LASTPRRLDLRSQCCAVPSVYECRPVRATRASPERRAACPGSARGLSAPRSGSSGGVNVDLIPIGITEELEALKRHLISMRPEDMSAADSAAMAAQISAIRLQLKRLEADRACVQEAVQRAAG